MGFYDSYKRLEKLCREIFNDDKPVLAYINEMRNTPQGSYYVKNWDEDLNNLKHYHWVRNQISHQPDCTEQNMCDPEDELWLNEFYSRIMNQTDPLSLYRQATTHRPADNLPPNHDEYYPLYIPSHHKKSSHSQTRRILLIVISIFIILESFLLLLLFWPGIL